MRRPRRPRNAAEFRPEALAGLEARIPLASPLVTQLARKPPNVLGLTGNHFGKFSLPTPCRDRLAIGTITFENGAGASVHE
jgi:hypothetical protein